MMRIFNGIKTTGIWITIIVIGIIAFINIFFTLNYVSPYTIQNPYFDFEIAVIGIIASAAILYGIYKIKDKMLAMKLRTLTIASIMITIIISVTWITMSKYVSATDSYSILVNALSIPNGWNKVDYLQRYPYQSGVLLYMLLYAYPMHEINAQTIYLIMEYVNIIPVCLTVLMLILITRELFNEEAAKITAILTSMFITIPLTVIQVYGNILSLPLVLSCVLIIVKTSHQIKTQESSISIRSFLIKMITVLIICFIIGALKLNNAILGIAMTLSIIIFSVDLIHNSTKSNQIMSTAMKTITALFIMMGILIVPMMMAGEQTSMRTVEILRNYDFQKKEQQSSIIFIGMGLNDKSDHGPGFYLSELGSISADLQKAQEESKTVIKNRINQLITNPIGFISFFANKLIYTWSDPTYSYETRPAKTLYDVRNNEQNTTKTIKDPLKNPNWKPVILNETPSQKIINSTQLMITIRTLTDGICIIISMFALIGAYMNRKNIMTMMLAIAITGGFLFHLIWETQPEYAYTYFILLIPYAAYGLYNYKKIPALFLKKLKKNQNQSTQTKNNNMQSFQK